MIRGELIMKKLDDMMDTFDKRVDKAIGSGYRYVFKYFTVFSATFLALLVVFVFFKIYYTKPHFIAQLIKADLYRLEEILHKVDKTCEILSLQNDREKINFLTIKSFSGSMVGGINLAHPKKWGGPYVKQNPSIQNKFYELVQAQDGYFVVPGNGVVLPNGAVMGRDVVINRKIALGSALQPTGLLNYKGVPLATKVTFKIGDWQRVPPSDDKLQNINKTLEEFNAAMPFTQSEASPNILVMR